MKWLSIVDEFTRECLVLEVERSITSRDVIDLLAEMFIIRGVSKHIRSDNGPEFIANAMHDYLEKTDVQTLYIEKARHGRTATRRASTAACVKNS